MRFWLTKLCTTASFFLGERELNYFLWFMKQIVHPFHFSNSDSLNGLKLRPLSNIKNKIKIS